MKNIWIINQYASHLETRHLELSKFFSENGYMVTVITSSYHHGRREYIYPEAVRHVERVKNVHYIYLKVKPEYKGNGMKRALSWFGFCAKFLQSMKVIEKTGGKPDYVIASSAPPTVWELGLYCARKYNAKYIAEFRDIWPLSLVEIQGLSPKHPAVIFFGVLEKRAYRYSDVIVSTMPYAYRHVRSVSGVACDKVRWMPNGINTEEADRMLKEAPKLPEELERYLSEHWCAVYTGSLAKCEHIDFLVDCFRKINNPEICLAIVGEGGEKENLHNMIEAYSLTNIRIFDAVERGQVPAVLDKAKCCIATVEDLPIYEYGLSVNKLCEYLYSGKPTVFACGVENIVKEAQHYSLPYNDVERVVETIKDIYSFSRTQLDELSERGKTLIKSDYDYKIIGSKYLEVLEGL